MTLGIYTGSEQERLELTKTLAGLRRAVVGTGMYMILQGIAILGFAISDQSIWSGLNGFAFAAGGVYIWRRFPAAGPIHLLQRHYELTDEALIVKTVLNGKHNEETRTSWRKVLYVKNDPDSVRLVIRDGGSLTIPGAVFETDEQRRTLLSLARYDLHTPPTV